MANDVKFAIKADSANAVQAFLKLDKAQQKTALNSSKYSRKTTSGMNSMLGTMGNVILGYASISTAISLVTSATDKMNAANDRAADSLKSTKFSSGKNFQIYDTPELQDKARAAINATRKSSGMSRDEATKLQFSLGSAQYDFQGQDLRDYFAGFYGTSEDPAKLITGSQKLIAGFGRDEVGSERQAVNKLLLASRTSDIDVDRMGVAASKIALSSGTIGASDEESLAILSVLAKTFESSDVAATSIRALATAIDKNGIGGAGFAEAIKKIQADPELKKKIGSNVRSKQGLTAYLGGAGEITALQSALIAEDKLPAGKGAGARVKSSMFGGLSLSSREAVAVRGEAIASQERLIAEENRRATGELSARATIDSRMALSENMGEGIFSSGARQSGMDFVKGNISGASNENILMGGDIAASVPQAIGNGGTLGILSDVMGMLITALMDNTDATAESTKELPKGKAANPDIFNNGVTE